MQEFGNLHDLKNVENARGRHQFYHNQNGVEPTGSNIYIKDSLTHLKQKEMNESCNILFNIR